MTTTLYGIELTLNDESKRNIFVRATSRINALRLACEILDINISEVSFGWAILIPMTEN